MGEAEKRQGIKEAQQQQRQIRPSWREQGPHTQKRNQSANDFPGARDSVEFSGSQIWSVASNWPIEVVCHAAAQGCCAQGPACLPPRECVDFLIDPTPLFLWEGPRWCGLK